MVAENQRVHLQNGYVLHRRPYSEASLLVEAITEDFGKVSLLAKGGRRIGKRGGAVLEPFYPLKLSWSGRGELRTLTGVECVGVPAGLSGVRLYCGFYLNELLHYLLQRDDPVPAVFRLYHQVLWSMTPNAQVELLLRYFEVDLLAELGYGLQLEYEADGQTPLDPCGLYHYLVDTGALRTTEPNGAVHGVTLIGLADKTLQDTIAAPEAKRLMRRVIDHYLGGHRLHSRALFGNPSDSLRL